MKKWIFNIFFAVCIAAVAVFCTREYARERDGDACWKVQEPTPGESNTGEKLVYVPAPEFSEESGFFSLIEEGEVFQQNVGIRIQGSTARLGPKKRFAVYARKEYSGSRYFGCDLFEGKKTHSFVLRPGFADAFTAELVGDRDLAVQRAVPVSVFLNGEYWYDAYIQEKYSDDYISQTYGVKKDNVVISMTWYWMRA